MKSSKVAELLSLNVKSRYISGKELLVYSKCILREFPDILEEYSKGRSPLAVCLQENHMDSVGFKLVSIVNYGRPKKIIALTIDGSPHCVQLHFATEQVKEITGVEVDHYVIEKGSVYQVGPETVKMARHLSKLEELRKHIEKGQK